MRGDTERSLGGGVSGQAPWTSSHYHLGFRCSLRTARPLCPNVHQYSIDCQDEVTLHNPLNEKEGGFQGERWGQKGH